MTDRELRDRMRAFSLTRLVELSGLERDRIFAIMVRRETPTDAERAALVQVLDDRV